MVQDPLYEAIRNNDLESAKLQLLAPEKNESLRNKHLLAGLWSGYGTQKQSPILLAAQFSSAAMVKLILRSLSSSTSCSYWNWPINDGDEMGLTPLHHVCNRGDLGLVEVLLNSPGIDIRVRSNEGFTPLHSTCNTDTNGTLVILKQLLSRGADVNCIDTDKSTPLHYAVLRGRLDIVEYLIKSGAKLSSKDIDGNTPLHLCVSTSGDVSRAVDMCKLLLHHNADLEATNRCGWSIAHKACYEGHKELAHALALSCALMNKKNTFGLTPHSFARNSMGSEIADFLLKSSVSERLWKARKGFVMFLSVYKTDSNGGKIMIYKNHHHNNKYNNITFLMNNKCMRTDSTVTDLTDTEYMEISPVNTPSYGMSPVTSNANLEFSDKMEFDESSDDFVNMKNITTIFALPSVVIKEITSYLQ